MKYLYTMPPSSLLHPIPGQQSLLGHINGTKLFDTEKSDAVEPFQFPLADLSVPLNTVRSAYHVSVDLWDIAKDFLVSHPHSNVTKDSSSDPALWDHLFPRRYRFQAEGQRRPRTTY